MGAGGTGNGGSGAGGTGGGYSGGGLANTGGTGYGGDLGGYGTAGETSGGAGGAGMAGYGGGGTAGDKNSGWGGPMGSAGANYGTPSGALGFSSLGQAAAVAPSGSTVVKDGQLYGVSFSYVKGEPKQTMTHIGPAPSGPPTSGNIGGTGYGGDLGAYGTAGEQSTGAGAAAMAGYGSRAVGGSGIAGVSSFGGGGGGVGGVSAPSTAPRSFSQALPPSTAPLTVNKSKLTMQPATPFAMTRPGVPVQTPAFGRLPSTDFGVFHAPPGLAAPMRGMGPFGTNMASPGGTFGADAGIRATANPSFNGNSRVGQGPSTGGSNVGAKGNKGSPTGGGKAR